MDAPGFMTPPRQPENIDGVLRASAGGVLGSEPAPPIPPRVSQLTELDGGSNLMEQTSPAAFGGASPAPKPGQLLIPNLASSQVMMQNSGGNLPPVPPRSPKLKQKLIEDLHNDPAALPLPVGGGAAGESLLDFHTPNNKDNDLLRVSASSMATERVVDDWEIDAEDLVFEKEIASGTFGSVWRGQYQRTPCAIKKLHGEKLSPKQLQEFHAEGNLLAS